MTQFTPQDMSLLKSILYNADDETLYEIFGTVYETVKAILAKQKQKEETKKPYEFHQRFGDILN